MRSRNNVRLVLICGGWIVDREERVCLLSEILQPIGTTPHLPAPNAVTKSMRRGWDSLRIAC